MAVMRQSKEHFGRRGRDVEMTMVDDENYALQREWVEGGRFCKVTIRIEGKRQDMDQSN